MWVFSVFGDGLCISLADCSLFITYIVEDKMIFAIKKNIALGKYSIKRTTFYINSCNPGTIYIHHLLECISVACVYQGRNTQSWRRAEEE
jgi:hypothetical protein